MDHLKLTDTDDAFVQVPPDAVMVFAGASGTETWIERDRDVTVRIVIKAVAVATSDNATLELRIDIGDGVARGHDGPVDADTHLRASQSVQVLVKAGERLAFKAYPNPVNAKVLRTVVFTADMKPVTADHHPDAEASRKKEPHAPDAAAA